MRSCALRLKQAQSSARRKRVVAVVWGRETLRAQRFQASHPQGCDAHRAGQSFVTELSSRLWSSRPDLYSPDASTTLPSNTSKKMSPSAVKCPLRTRLPRMESTCSKGTYNTEQELNSSPPLQGLTVSTALVELSIRETTFFPGTSPQTEHQQ